MRSVCPDGVERDWHATAWMAAGFGLAAVGGFFGSLLKERSALEAARQAAYCAGGTDSDGVPPLFRTRIGAPATSGTVARPAELKA
jgi:hypothetical protein